MSEVTEYIGRDVAIAKVNYVEGEHPYAKDARRPETYSAYNEGWSAACDRIRGQIETIEAAEVQPVIHAHWVARHVACEDPYECSHCGDSVNVLGHRFCPNCGAIMDEEVNP